jgi:hypothetical protein
MTRCVACVYINYMLCDLCLESLWQSIWTQEIQSNLTAIMNQKSYAFDFHTHILYLNNKVRRLITS